MIFLKTFRFCHLRHFPIFRSLLASWMIRNYRHAITIYGTIERNISDMISPNLQDKVYVVSLIAPCGYDKVTDSCLNYTIPITLVNF